MPITLYDLVGTDDRRFSPACWPISMALAHKGLDFVTHPTPFTEIPTIEDGQQKSVPVIAENGLVLSDSWAIAQYLDETYPNAPTLFGGPVGLQLTEFARNWTLSVVTRQVVSLILKDIYDHLLPQDQSYFRTSREKRFGKTLEAVQAGREDRLKPFQNSLTPLRMTVSNQPFVGGEQPIYADYVIFGVFQWSRVVSPFKLLEADDPVMAWFDRCLDLHDGLGRSALGYEWK